MGCLLGKRNRDGGKNDADGSEDGIIFVSTTLHDWNDKENADLNAFLFNCVSEEDSGVFLALLNPTGFSNANNRVSVDEF